MDKKKWAFGIGALILVAASFVAGMLVSEWRQLEEATDRHSTTAALARDPTANHDSRTKISPPATFGSAQSAMTATSSIISPDHGKQTEKFEEVVEEMPSAEPQIAIPMALSHPETFTNLSLDQRAVVAGIADDFVEAVRASGAYPQTDAYKKAWEEAASNADEALRIRLGIEAYQKMGNGR